jgi:RNA polymerase sigma-70 factor (ECF subfamily)
MASEAVQGLVDSELIARAQAGDPHAMDDLLHVLQPVIVRYCRFRLSTYAGGRDAADDAAQETCLAVAHVLPKYTDYGLPFNAWVYAIAANKVADSQRRFGRAALLVDDLPEQVEPSLTPEESAIASVEFTTALGLVHLLPVKMREVMLRRAAGASAKTVAEDLGMTAGAVNVAYHRAVARLRSVVEESEEFRELFDAYRSETVVVVVAA